MTNAPCTLLLLLVLVMVISLLRLLPMKEFIFLQPHSFLLNERQLLMVATLCIHHPRREADIIPTVLSRNTSFVLFKWFIFCFSFISGFREWCCSLGVWGNKSGLWSTRLSVFLEADWNNKKKNESQNASRFK